MIDAMCTGVHTSGLEVKRTAAFHRWLMALKDNQARVRINARLTRFAAGNPGDYKSVGDGVYELRIDYGPGYRVYYAKWGHLVVWLLCGGNKRTQAADISRAKQLKALLES